MPEEEKKPEEPQESKESQENPVAAPETNSAPTAEDLAAIKAQLEEEKKAKAAAETAITERDTRIAELEAALKVATATTAELTAAKDAYTKAVAKYLEASRSLNPTIPGDVIVGQTIEEIDASVAKAVSIATAVKATLEAQAKEAKVPAGAPTRGELPLEGLSPREKIAAGIKQTPM